MEMTVKEALEHLDAARIEWNEGYAYQKLRFEALDMAIEALKAQEPRVLTLEEVIEAVKQGEPMYICEVKFPGSARWIIPINADHWGFEERGSHCQFHYYDYLSKQIGGFCCWTSRPTDEQREATPWQ